MCGLQKIGLCQQSISLQLSLELEMPVTLNLENTWEALVSKPISFDVNERRTCLKLVFSHLDQSIPVLSVIEKYRDRGGDAARGQV